MQKNKLNSNHIKDLHKSGLSDETIEQSKIVSLSSREAKELGYKPQPGMLIPYPGTDDFNFKPDNPAEDRKYIRPTGSKNRVYFPPNIDKDKLNDPSIPLYITEGEKKTLKGHQEGLLIVGLSGVWNWSAGKDENGISILLEDLKNIPFTNRQVYIVFDSDIIEKPPVQQALYALSRELKNRGAKQVITIKLPTRGDGNKTGLDDYLINHTVEDLEKLPKEEVDTYREIIITDNIQDGQMTKRFKEVLQEENKRRNNPIIYSQGHELVRPHYDPKTHMGGIEILNKANIAEIADIHPKWMRRTKEGLKPVLAPSNVVRDAYAGTRVVVNEELEYFSNTPIIGQTKNLFTERGYYREEKLWMQTTFSIKIPKNPTFNQLKEAVEFIEENVFVDFPWEMDSDKANAWSFLFTPFVLRLVNNRTPLFLIDAPRPRSGKSLLVTALDTIAYGHFVPMTQAPTNEDEMEKKLNSFLFKGVNRISFDNWKDGLVLDSSCLSSYLTSSRVEGRVLGVNETKFAINNVIFSLTGNNINLSAEMARRVVRIRLKPQVEMPHLRTGFKHPDLLNWITKNRLKLLESTLTIIQYWITDGYTFNRKKKMGSFEKWSMVLGGLMQYVGLGEEFLAGLEEVYKQVSSEGEEQRGFIEVWWDTFGGDEVKVRKLYELCEKENVLLYIIKGRKTSVIDLGYYLRKLKGCIFGNYEVCCRKVSAQNVYYLKKI